MANEGQGRYGQVEGTGRNHNLDDLLVLTDYGRTLPKPLPQPNPDVLNIFNHCADELQALIRERLRRYIEEGVEDVQIAQIIQASKVSAVDLYLALSRDYERRIDEQPVAVVLDGVQTSFRERLRRYIEEGVVDDEIKVIVAISRVSASDLYLALSRDYEWRVAQQRGAGQKVAEQPVAGRKFAPRQPLLPPSAVRAGVNYPSK